ncbi:fimbrial protein [Escherichia coli]|nr:fimbrial protein [Escherichia coli]EFC0334614.1 fimbrial protein [Escherichia coli]EFG7427999.1 fimbrial protein [Escherichia coli]
MSTPSFHQHFRQLAGMSPLRYQKWLRLNEVRRTMLNEHYDVTTAAYAVGYESLSHFRREYLRMVRSSRLAKAGDLSSAVGFNIKLNDCDTNVSSNAAVAFLGTTVTSNDDTLALQSSAAGSAQNVGIQILDRTGEVLILDGATFSAKTDLIDGTNILPFQARYIALGQSVAGTANADATFKVQYL